MAGATFSFVFALGNGRNHTEEREEEDSHVDSLPEKMVVTFLLHFCSTLKQAKQASEMAR